MVMIVIISKALTSYSSRLYTVQRDCYTLVYSQRDFFLLFITYIRRRKLPAITNISETVWRVPHISGARYLRLITRNAQYYIYIVYIVVCSLYSFFPRCLMGIASVIQPAIRTRPKVSLSLLFTHIDSVYILLFSHGWGDSAVRHRAKRWHLTKNRDHHTERERERESLLVTRVCSGNELLRPAPITSEIRNSVIIYRPKTNTHTQSQVEDRVDSERQLSSLSSHFAQDHFRWHGGKNQIIIFRHHYIIFFFFFFSDIRKPLAKTLSAGTVVRDRLVSTISSSPCSTPPPTPHRVDR